jgi:general secretion pathway protein C
VPNFQDGKASGMKILSVKPGSVFAKLGLKRGDILNRINGVELDVRKGFEIFSQLKDQKSLSLDLVRGGANQTVEYEIR